MHKKRKNESLHVPFDVFTNLRRDLLGSLAFGFTFLIASTTTQTGGKPFLGFLMLQSVAPLFWWGAAFLAASAGLWWGMAKGIARWSRNWLTVLAALHGFVAVSYVSVFNRSHSSLVGATAFAVIAAGLLGDVMKLTVLERLVSRMKKPES